MFLMTQNDVDNILNDSTLLLEGSGVDNTLMMLRVIIPNPIKQLAGIEITQAGDLVAGLMIALATLDLLAAVDKREDLLGSEQNPELGVCLPCISSTDITSSLIHNMCVAAASTHGAVHTSGVKWSIVPDDGLVLLVERTITNMGYQPVISLYVNGKMRFQGDPGTIIMYKD